MNAVLVVEVVSGVIGLLLLAMAFTEVAWGQGASQHEMKLKSRERSKRLFVWAGVFWLIAACCMVVVVFS